MMSASKSAQRGATLVVGLIMLVLITLMVTTAFVLSNGNLKAVGNMQFREEAIAAANVAIESVISTDFTANPQPLNNFGVDIDQDGRVDYSVNVAVPQCIKGVAAPPDPASLSGVESGLKGLLDFNTVWEVRSAVNDATTGAKVTVWQGVRKRMTQPMYDISACI